MNSKVSALAAFFGQQVLVRFSSLPLLPSVSFLNFHENGAVGTEANEGN
jgi:hypothetical protein